MADITGYSQLGLVGFTDKGDYAAGNTYMMNDLVHYQNSVWRCKADQTSGVTPGENNNWTIFVNGTNDLNAIIAADVQGLLGEAGAQGVNAQNLINAIAEKVATKVLMKTDLVSQIVNDATKAASMAALYAVNAKIGDVENLPNSAADVVTAITQQNSNLQTTNNNLQSVKDNMTHLSKMFRWQEVIVPIGELKENGGEVFNKTYIIPKSYFENGKWTTAAITGFVLSGTGYTNCSVTGCRVIGNKIEYSVKNMGLTGLKNIELKVYIMFVLL